MGNTVLRYYPRNGAAPLSLWRRPVFIIIRSRPDYRTSKIPASDFRSAVFNVLPWARHAVRSISQNLDNLAPSRIITYRNKIDSF